MRNRSGQSPSAFLRVTLFALLLTTFSFLGQVRAATTDTISFQSKLTSTDGTNISNGTYNFRFRMYSVSSGGTAHWTEDRSLVVNAGVVSVDLGAVQSFPSDLFDYSDLYLQVCFDANGTDLDSSDANCGSGSHRYEEVFSTRKAITAVPVALRAKYLTDGAGNAYGTNDFFIQGGNAFGAVGVIGTTDNFGLEFRTNNSVVGSFDIAGTFEMAGLAKIGAVAVDDAPSNTYGPALWGGTFNNGLTIKRDLVDLSMNVVTGSLIELNIDPSTPPTADSIGALSLVHSNASNSEDFASLYGVYGEALHSGSGTADYLYGGYFSASRDTSTGGAVGTTYGISAYAADGDNIIAGSFVANRQLGAINVDTKGISSFVSNQYAQSSGVDNTYGSYVSVSRQNATGGTVNTYGIYAELGGDNAGSGVHTTYGLYLENFGGGDTNYAIYTNGTTPSRFGGNVTTEGILGIKETGTTPTYYTYFQGGDQAGDITYTLPTASSNGVLTNTGGVLSWAAGGGGGISQVGSMTSSLVFGDATADDDWLGLGASAGRIEFDDLAIDEVNILGARVGIGTSTPTDVLSLVVNETDNAVWGGGMSMFYDYAPTSAGTGYPIGILNSVSVGSGNINGMLGLIGIQNEVSNDGSGDIDNLIGMITSAYNSGANQVTSIIGASISAGASAGAATNLIGLNVSANDTIPGVTNIYGIYVAAYNDGIGDTQNRYTLYLAEDEDGSTAVNDFGLYSADPNVVNYFAGNVGVGTVSPTSFVLQVAGDIGPDADDTYDLGSSSLRFRDLYLGGNTLHIGSSLTDEGTISYNTITNVLGISTDSTTNGDIAFFTNQLFLDKSSGNVGIGTTSPLSTLNIADNTGPVTLTSTLLGDPGTTGALGRYAFRAETTEAPSWTTAYNTPESTVSAFAYDYENGVLYAAAGGGNGVIYRCVVSSGCDISGDWAEVYDAASLWDQPAIVFDAATNTIFSTSDGVVSRCDTSTGCDAPGDWANVFTSGDDDVLSLGVDTANSILYVGSAWTQGIIYRCDIAATSCDASGDFTTSFDTPDDGLTSMVYDAANGTMYAGSEWGGEIYRCDTATDCDTGTDWTVSGDLPGTGNLIHALAIDTTNEILYATSDDVIYRCPLSSGCDAFTDWSVSYDTNLSGVYSLGYDAVHERMFAGTGNTGIVYQCATSTGCDSSSDWSVSYDSTQNSILSLGVVNGVVYAGSGNGGFIYRFNDSTSPTYANYAAIEAYAVDTVTGSEDGRLSFKTMLGGTEYESLRVAGNASTFYTSLSLGTSSAGYDATFNASGVNRSLFWESSTGRLIGRDGSNPMVMFTTQPSTADGVFTSFNATGTSKVVQFGNAAMNIGGGGKFRLFNQPTWAVGEDPGAMSAVETLEMNSATGSIGINPSGNASAPTTENIRITSNVNVAADITGLYVTGSNPGGTWKAAYFGGNVGINTTGPDAQLDVLGTSGQQLRLSYADGTAYTGFVVDSSGNLSIVNSGTYSNINSSLRISETLSIREGGTSPTYRTIFQGGDQAGDITYTLPTASTNGFLQNTGGVLSWAAGSSSVTVGSMTGGTLFADATADDDWLGLGASAGRIEFDDQTVDEVNVLGARFGIGTSTPLATLSVKGTDDGATLGSEAITVTADRDFSSNTGNWSGTNWSISSGRANHTSGSNNYTYSSLSVVSGTTYQITATVSTSTGGTIAPSIGGVSGQTVGSSTGVFATYVWVLTASSTASLSFVPNSSWVGYIDNISVKVITQAAPVFSLENSSGVVFLETVNGGATNLFLGKDSGANNISTNNTAVGTSSLESNVSGTNNSALGYNVMKYNSTGSYNVGIGARVLETNLVGSFNAALGYRALGSNISGIENTAIGNNSLLNNISGSGNVGIGSKVLAYNSSGTNNVAIGYETLYSNLVGGSNNIGIGYRSGYSLSGLSSDNIAIGAEALFSAAAGVYSNIAIGRASLMQNSGNYNVALGENTLMALRSNPSGSITDIEDYDGIVTGTVKVTSTGHGLPPGTTSGMDITGTIYYDGTYNATYIDSDTFYINTPFASGDTIDTITDYSGTEAGTVLVTTTGNNVASGIDSVILSGTNYYDGTYSGYYVSNNSFYVYVTYTSDDSGGEFRAIEDIGTWSFSSIGELNLALGNEAGATLLAGQQNVFIGAYDAVYAADQATIVSNSIAIGYGAYTTASNQTVIGNSLTTQTLIRRGTLGISETGATPTKYTFFQGGDQSVDITYTLPTASTNGFLQNTGGVLSWAAGGGGVGQVGSMTSSTVFGDATADDDWLGLGASAGRIAFDDQAIDYVNILDANVGIGDASPLALLTVGSGDLFQIDSSGSIKAIDGVAHTIDSFLGSLRFTSNSDSIYIEDDLISDPNSVSLGSTSDPWGNIYLHPNSSIYMGVIGDQASFYYDEYLNQLEINGTAGTNLRVFDDLFVSSTSGKIGVGTSTPQTTLDVVGTGAFSALGVKYITGSIDPTASTTVTGTGTLFLSEVDPGDRIALDGTATITGSIDPTASTAVTGVGTLFLTELKVGDQITVNAETRTVIAIASNTSLTVGVAFTDTANDTSIVRTSTEIRTVVSIASNTSLTVERAFLDNSADSQITVYRDTFDVTGAALFKGGALFTGLGTPGAPTVTPQGTTGAATWTYKISAVNATGNETVLSANGSTTSGNATLSGTNFNRITWSATPGAAAYRIYRVATGTSPNTTGYIGTVDAHSTLQFDDTGIGIMGGYSGSVFDETSNVGIGTLKTPPRDTLTVDGRINQTWHYMFEDFFGGRANQTANAVINAGNAMSFAIIGTSGCTASYPSVANGVYRMTSGATAALGCLLSQAGTAGLPNIKQVDVSLAPVLEVVLNPGATSAKTMIVGFSNQTTATVAEPTNGLYFYATTATGDQWVATARASSVSTTQPTGVTTNTNTYQVLRIEASATHARYYINDVLVADLRTNIPASGATLEFVVGHATTAAAAKTVDIDSIEFWQDDPVVSGMPGQLPAGFDGSNLLQNHMLYSDTTYAKGASEETIPEGYVVSFTDSSEFDDNGKNRLVYNIEKSKAGDKTVLGIGSGLIDPNAPFEIGLNPYAVALYGPTYAWVEEGGETEITLGQELRLSSKSEGVLSIEGGQIIARSLESVDWSVIEEVEGQPKRKLIKVFVMNGGSQNSSLVAGGVGDYFTAVDDSSIQTPYRIIANSLVATTAEVNVLKSRTLNVNDNFLVDDEGNVSTTGSLFAGAIETPVIKGVAGGLNINIGEQETFTVSVGDTKAIEASVKGVKVNNLLVSEQQAGKVTLPAGRTTITVRSELVTAESVVVVTPNIPVVTAVKTNSGYFVISIATASSQDIELAWYVVNIDR